MGVLPQPVGQSDGLVLRVWPCGESSVVASLLTREHGYVKVIAKAARRAKSRLRALVEPGSLVAAEFSMDPRRELQYLRGGTVVWAPLGPGSSLEHSAFLLGALELVDRCRPLSTNMGAGQDHSATEALYEICDDFIRVLSSPACRRLDLAFFAFEWSLLVCHGITPEVTGCTSCGLDEKALAAETMWFSPSEGGAVCGRCARGDGVNCGKPLSLDAWQVFRELTAQGVELGDEDPLVRTLRRELGAHLHNFLGYHLPGYRLPVALDLLRARKESS